MLSADSTAVVGMTPASLDDKNLYNYCDGNPVGRIDESGALWSELATQVVGGVIWGGVMAGLSSAVSHLNGSGDGDVGAVICDTIIGAVEGGFSGVMSELNLVGDIVSATVNTGLSAMLAWERTDGSVMEKAKNAIVAGVATAVVSAVTIFISDKTRILEYDVMSKVVVGSETVLVSDLIYAGYSYSQSGTSSGGGSNGGNNTRKIENGVTTIAGITIYSYTGGPGGRKNRLSSNNSKKSAKDRWMRSRIGLAFS